MRTQEITINLKGKSTQDISDALKEAIRVISLGNTLGRNSNDTGEYSFNVKDGFETIIIEDITEEATYIAEQLKDISQEMLYDFATSSDGGLSLDDCDDYIDGNLASIIQVLIDEQGGADNDGDETIVKKLNAFFELDEPLVALEDEATMRP